MGGGGLGWGTPSQDGASNARAGAGEGDCGLDSLGARLPTRIASSLLIRKALPGAMTVQVTYSSQKCIEAHQWCLWCLCFFGLWRLTLTHFFLP
jgi:hypothetical protein